MTLENENIKSPDVELQAVNEKFSEIVKNLEARRVKNAVFEELRRSRALRDRFRDLLAVLQCDHGLGGPVLIVKEATKNNDIISTEADLTRLTRKVKGWFNEGGDLKEFELLNLIWDCVYRKFPRELEGIVFEIELIVATEELHKVFNFNLPDFRPTELYFNTYNGISDQTKERLGEWEYDRYLNEEMNHSGWQYMLISPYLDRPFYQVHLFLIRMHRSPKEKMPFVIHDYFEGVCYELGGRCQAILKSKLDGRGLSASFRSGADHKTIYGAEGVKLTQVDTINASWEGGLAGYDSNKYSNIYEAQLFSKELNVTEHVKEGCLVEFLNLFNR